MLPGARSDKGALFISTGAPVPEAELVAGILVGPLGVLFCSTLPPQVFPNGIGTRHNGLLCIAPGGIKANSMNGLPVTAEGALVVQLNVAFGINDPYVGGIRVGPFGGIYCVDIAPPAQFGFSNGFSNGFDINTGGGPVVFNPSDLFAAGEQGAWYDPSDFSTMFQDSAGTTPVTAVGQSVGKINDKSGNGNHATQATTAACPVLQIDGNSKYYLGFDGVDDTMVTAAINFTATDKMSVFFGISTISSANQGILVCGNSVPGSLNAIYAAGLPPPIRGTLFGDSGVSQIIVAGDTSGTNQVVSQLYDLAGATATDEIKIRKNGSLPTQDVATVGPAGGGMMGSDTLIIGDFVGLLLNGRIYSMIVRGAASTPTEITDTETWVNGKTGAY